MRRRPRVHSGYADSWKACRPAVMTHLHELFSSGAVVGKSAHIYITGHSLGKHPPTSPMHTLAVARSYSVVAMPCDS